MAFGNSTRALVERCQATSCNMRIFWSRSRALGMPRLASRAPGACPARPRRGPCGCGERLAVEVERTEHGGEQGTGRERPQVRCRLQAGQQPRLVRGRRCGAQGRSGQSRTALCQCWTSVRTSAGASCSRKAVANPSARSQSELAAAGREVTMIRMSRNSVMIPLSHVRTACRCVPVTSSTPSTRSSARPDSSRRCAHPRGMIPARLPSDVVDEPLGRGSDPPAWLAA